MVKPVIKWVGGKTQILPHILNVFPKHMNNYYEPFIGGGSILLGFLEKVNSKEICVSGHIIACDLNERLIWLYKNIQNRLGELMNELDVISIEYNNIQGTEINRKPTTKEQALTSKESYYYWTRKLYNDDTCLHTPKISAMFIFLNKTCFRGMYREGNNGFNVPFGHYKDSTIYTRAHLEEVSSLIANVVFKHLPYQEVLNNIAKGDFVYMDPPYVPINDKSFVGYTSNGFTMEDHEEFIANCHMLAEVDINFVLSNADVGLVRDNFMNENYDYNVISCRRAINSKNPDSRCNEVIVVHRSTD